jgi:hypothetical protein
MLIGAGVVVVENRCEKRRVKEKIFSLLLFF